MLDSVEQVDVVIAWGVVSGGNHENERRVDR
jgi:hypothetical protein